MTKTLEQLIESARSVKMNAAERDAQRQSFAYGNSKLENRRITRGLIKRQSKALAAEDAQKH